MPILGHEFLNVTTLPGEPPRSLVILSQSYPFIKDDSLSGVLNQALGRSGLGPVYIPEQSAAVLDQLTQDYMAAPHKGHRVRLRYERCRPEEVSGASPRYHVVLEAFHNDTGHGPGQAPLDMHVARLIPEPLLWSPICKIDAHWCGHGTISGIPVTGPAVYRFPEQHEKASQPLYQSPEQRRREPA